MDSIKVNVTRLANRTDNVKALADIQVNGIGIRGLRVISGSKGDFCAMPSRPRKRSQTGYVDVAYPASKELHDAIQKAVLEEYAKA